MSGTLSQYTYRPLETPTSLRILKLYPASAYSDPLEASLIHVDRKRRFIPVTEASADGSYDAVSYCWGDYDLSCSLLLDGHPFPITPNVGAMLRCLRRKSPGLRPRHLWIDAICLNQLDVNEKSIQVQLMGDVFRQADRVRIWLGESSAADSIPQVFAFWKAMAVKTNPTTEPSEQNASHSSSLWSSISGGDDQQSILGFLARPWFRRRWILQEVQFGHHTNVHCGAHKIPWIWLQEGICGMPLQYPGFEEEHIQAVQTVLGLRRGRRGYLETLRLYHSAQCTEPRDRLFALYGMASDVHSPGERSNEGLLALENPDGTIQEMPQGSMGLPINQRSSWAQGHVSRGIISYRVTYSGTWAEAYKRFAKACINAGQIDGIFEHLASFGSLYDQSVIWPSWVPNWSQSMSWARRFILNSSTATQAFNPIAHFKSTVEIDQQGRLRMLGSFYEIVEMANTSRPTSESSSETMFQNQLMHYLRESNDRDNRRFQPGNLSLVLTSALLDAHLDLGKPERFGTLRKESDELLKKGALPLDLQEFGSTYEESFELLRVRLEPTIRDSSMAWLIVSWPAHQMFQATCKILKNRRLFYAQHNKTSLVGIGPDTMQSGDHVMRFPINEHTDIKPATTAFVVRPALQHYHSSGVHPAGEDRTYRFIGMCHLALPRTNDIPVEQPARAYATFI